jgi:hypothetical protein
LPVIETARFSDTTPGGDELAVRDEYHVDPKNQPRPNAVTIAPAIMQRGMQALSGATASKMAALILSIEPNSVLGPMQAS